MAVENRNASHNNFGDHAQFYQGNVNHIHQSLPNRLVELNSIRNAGFNGDNKQHTPSCLPKTREAVLDGIRDWAERDGEVRIYWLKGMAGTGKSTIALTVAREYHNKKQLGASFFFSRGGGDLASARKFPETIAAQLADYSDELRKQIDRVLASNHQLPGLDIYSKWEILVMNPLRIVGRAAIPKPVMIVVDALDECDDEYDIPVVIQCLVNVAAQKGRQIELRVFVTSRPDQPVNTKFRDLSTDIHHDFILHNIEQPIVDQDLKTFYNHELAHVANQNGINHPSLDVIIQSLVGKSHGLFIHAATVIRFIREGGVLAGERLNAIIGSIHLPLKSVESELDYIYTTVLTLSLNTSLDQDEMRQMQRVFHNVVGSIVILRDTLSMNGLAMMLEEPMEMIKSALDQLHSVLDIPEQDDAPIRLLHPSFRDFLLDPTRCTNLMFSIDAIRAHAFLFECCLKIMSGHLRRNMCNLPHPGFQIGRAHRLAINRHIPTMLQYACLHWVKHLENGRIDPRTHLGLVGFFRARYLFWIEILALMGRLNEAQDAMDYLKPRVFGKRSVNGILFRARAAMSRNPSSPTTLAKLVYDAHQFLRGNARLAASAPLQLYVSALLFCQPLSIMRRLNENQMPKWISFTTPTLKDALINLYKHPSPSWLTTATFSPNLSFFGLISFEGVVELWNTATCTIRCILKSHSISMDKITFSSDSSMVASWSHDLLQLWDTAAGKRLHTFKGWLGHLHTVALSPDNRFALLGYSNAPVDVLHLKTVGTRRILDGYPSLAPTVNFSPDGRLVALGSDDGTTCLWDMETGSTKLTLRHSSSVSHAIFAPNNRLLATVSNDKTIHLWDTTTGVLQHTLDGYAGIHKIAFSPNSTIIASQSYKHCIIRIWNAVDGSMMREIAAHMPLLHLSFPCNNHIITERGILQIYSIPPDCCSQIYVNENWIKRGDDNVLYLDDASLGSFLFAWGNSVLLRGRLSGVIRFKSSVESVG
ncbi:Vegetative incompatibility HET-E-1-like protein [Cladobotryum mycophilum]|uniref:Vegetative incompatibility HET-E-1-like protein n=1 Tax=Cladobotryum mycophilum TaxID=491253 RepID=A0ABR0S7U6_9HYPO